MGRKIPIPTPLPLLHKISQKHAVAMKLGTNKPCTNAFQKTYHLFPLVLLFIFQHDVITFFSKNQQFSGNILHIFKQCGRKIPIPTPLLLLHKISQKHAVAMKLGTNKPCTNAFQKTYHLFPLVLLFIFWHDVITLFLKISNFLKIYYIFSSSVLSSIS